MYRSADQIIRQEVFRGDHVAQVILSRGLGENRGWGWGPAARSILIPLQQRPRDIHLGWGGGVLVLDAHKKNSKIARLCQCHCHDRKIYLMHLTPSYMLLTLNFKKYPVFINHCTYHTVL